MQTPISNFFKINKKKNDSLNKDKRTEEVDDFPESKIIMGKKAKIEITTTTNDTATRDNSDSPSGISNKTKIVSESILNKKKENKKKENSTVDLTLKPTETKISQKTLDIMKKLKNDQNDRMNRFLRDTERDSVRNESSFSLKFKYEDLLKEHRELIIPPHYKLLLNMQNYLDHTINAFKLKSKKPLLDELKKAMFINYKQYIYLVILESLN